MKDNYKTLNPGIAAMAADYMTIRHLFYNLVCQAYSYENKTDYTPFERLRVDWYGLDWCVDVNTLKSIPSLIWIGNGP